MENNSKNGNKKDDNNSAVNIAWKKFEERHPRESWPDWLTRCIRISSSKITINNWLVKITVLPKSLLKPGQHLEEKNGVPVLVEVDPLTGERWIVICGGPADAVEVLFEAEVDLDNGSATVITDIDIDHLDGTKYELSRT